MVRPLTELVEYRQLLKYLVILDLKLRYRGSFFGFLWTLLNPLLLMIVMWAVFSRVARVETENYALFLLSALMVWTFFSQSVTAGLSSIIKNRGLIRRIYMPKIVFPISVVSSNLVNLMFFLAAYVLIAFASGTGVPATVIYLPLIIIMLFVLSTGVAMFLCSLNVFFRDMTHLTTAILRALFYLTPIFYRPNLLGENTAELLKLNPVYFPVVGARAVLYQGSIPELDFWLTGFGVAVGMFILGLFTFTRSEERFVYYV